jgi:hypothetical protein
MMADAVIGGSLSQIQRQTMLGGRIFARIILVNEPAKTDDLSLILNTAKFPESLHCQKPDLTIP